MLTSDHGILEWQGGCKRGSMEQPEPSFTQCINCGGDLTIEHGLVICAECNSKSLAEIKHFELHQDEESPEYQFIECPGATLYADDTTTITAGVIFVDDNDITKGFRIIDHAVYAPLHTKRRRIPTESAGHIRRCQACQDLTIRMRRKEGADFCIPSEKFPKRQKLRSVFPQSRV